MDANDLYRNQQCLQLFFSSGARPATQNESCRPSGGFLDSSKFNNSPNSDYRTTTEGWLQGEFAGQGGGVSSRCRFSQAGDLRGPGRAGWPTTWGTGGGCWW